MTSRVASAAGPRIRHLFGLGVSEGASERRARVVSHRKWVCAHTHTYMLLTDSEGREGGHNRTGRTDGRTDRQEGGKES